MARRPHPTLADYAVIGISPALIMCLIGSLVFFLITVFYQGQFDTRLSFIMAMFIMAAVCIARISIEQGREYASLFALPLAGVTLFAMFRFVEFSGAFARLSGVFNIGLIAMIWFFADKLTWDCTVIDENQDLSGKGLLQTGGLEDEPSDLETEAASEDPIATPPPVATGLWQKFVEHRRRPHAPGMWVIYFSLAALPIFGFGKFFLRDDISRKYAFKLLVLYAAAALGLLLTTSFLGLRRYLRQRRLEMPLEMAGTWLGVGAVMIVALLAICMLLPRRNAEYSVSDISFLNSPIDLPTSDWAVGNDGQEQDEAERKVKQDDAAEQMEGQKGEGGKTESEQGKGGPESKQAKDNKGGKKSGKQNSKGQKQEQPEGDQGDSSKSQQDQEASQNEPAGDQEPRDPQDPAQPYDPEENQPDPSDPSQQENQDSESEKQQSKSDQDKFQQSKSQQSKSQQSKSQQSKSQQSKSQQSKSQQSKSQQSKSQQSKSQESQSKQGKQSKSKKSSASSSSRSSPPNFLSNLSPTLGGILKALYWLIAIVVVGYLLWKNWEKVRHAVRNFIKAMQDLWARLFGGGPREDDAVESATTEAAPDLRRFSDFSDPFVSGRAERESTGELIAYTFEAFEAWGHENGCGRLAEQTPIEFAKQAVRFHPELGKEALRVAELYNWTAFGKSSVPDANREYLRRFWQELSSCPVA